MKIKILFLYLCFSGFTVSASAPLPHTYEEIAALQQAMSSSMTINTLEGHKERITKVKEACEKLKLMEESIQNHDEIKVNEIMEYLADLYIIKQGVDERNYISETALYILAICSLANNRAPKYKDKHKKKVMRSQIDWALYFWQFYTTGRIGTISCNPPYKQEFDEIKKYNNLWFRKIPSIEDSLRVLNDLCQNPKGDPGSIACFLEKVFYKKIVTDDDILGLNCIIDGIDNLILEQYRKRFQEAGEACKNLQSKHFQFLTRDTSGKKQLSPEIRDILDALDITKTDGEINSTKGVMATMKAIHDSVNSEIKKRNVESMVIYSFDSFQSQISSNLLFLANSLQNFKIELLLLAGKPLEVKHEQDEIACKPDIWLEEIPLIDDSINTLLGAMPEKYIADVLNDLITNRIGAMQQFLDIIIDELNNSIQTEKNQHTSN